jgi:hypothetical protein
MHFFTLDTASRDQGCFFSPLPLTDIHRFVKKMHTTLRQHEKDLVACASKYNGKVITNTALLIGAFLILGKGLEYDDVISAFRPLSRLFVPYSDPSISEHDGFMTVMDCWKALYHAKSLGWLDMSKDPDIHHAAHPDSFPVAGKPMDLDECIHYSDPVNGDLHSVIPGKLIFFANPTNLSDGLHWLDSEGERRFSPAFYADLFTDFDVVLVICLEECDYDRGPFAAAGVGVEELCLRPDTPNMLRAADRFFCLLEAAPGAVALHGGRSGLSYAGTLVSAHMMSRLAFGAGDAAAWLRMACPALLVPPEYLAALHDDAGVLQVL